MALDMNNFSTDMTKKEAVYSEKKIRIGFIGTGGIAHSHIKAYLNQPDVEIVAACDLIPGKAADFLKEYGIDAPAFESHKEMLDKVEMDAVSVCAYNRNHCVCTVDATACMCCLKNPCPSPWMRPWKSAALKRRTARSCPSASSPVWTRTCR